MKKLILLICLIFSAHSFSATLYFTSSFSHLHGTLVGHCDDPSDAKIKRGREIYHLDINSSNLSRINDAFNRGDSVKVSTILSQALSSWSPDTLVSNSVTICLKSGLQNLAQSYCKDFLIVSNSGIFERFLNNKILENYSNEISVIDDQLTQRNTIEFELTSDMDLSKGITFSFRTNTDVSCGSGQYSSVVSTTRPTLSF